KRSGRAGTAPLFRVGSGLLAQGKANPGTQASGAPPLHRPRWAGSAAGGGLAADELAVLGRLDAVRLVAFGQQAVGQDGEGDVRRDGVSLQAEPAGHLE